MITRINQILQEKELSQSQFATAINIQRSTLSHIMSGRNNPSLDFVLKVVETFPDISLDWLARGVGNMYNNQNNNQQQTSIEVEKEVDKTEKKKKKETVNTYSLFEEYSDDIEETDTEEEYISDKKSEEPKKKAIAKEQEKNEDVAPKSEKKQPEADKNIKNEQPNIAINMSQSSNNDIENKKIRAESVIILYNDGTYQVLK